MYIYGVLYGVLVVREKNAGIKYGIVYNAYLSACERRQCTWIVVSTNPTKIRGYGYTQTLVLRRDGFRLYRGASVAVDFGIFTFFRISRFRAESIVYGTPSDRSTKRRGETEEDSHSFGLAGGARVHTHRSCVLPITSCGPGTFPARYAHTFEITRIRYRVSSVWCNNAAAGGALAV